MSMLLTKDPTEARIYRLSVQQFDRVTEARVFRPNGRLELVNGVLAEMPSVGAGNVAMVAQLQNRLALELQRRAGVFTHCAIECGRHSLPLPDLAVVSLPYDRYYDRRPNAADVIFVVEVTDSSPPYERTVKVPLYGSHGISEVWVVDLPQRSVHVCTDPTNEGYATTATLTTGDTLVPTAFPDVEIPVRDLGLDRLR